MDNSVFGNIKANLTTKQKIAIGLFFVIIAILLVVLAGLMMDTDTDTQTSGDTENEIIETVEETYTDERGVTFDVTVDTMTDENGEIITTGTKEDEYGNTTTLDPNLITTYFPYQVMREHESIDPTFRYFVNINEERKTIYATVEACDEAEDRRLVREYIKSIPLDLSKYTVEFNTVDFDVICEY